MLCLYIYLVGKEARIRKTIIFIHLGPGALCANPWKIEDSRSVSKIVAIRSKEEGPLSRRAPSMSLLGERTLPLHFPHWGKIILQCCLLQIVCIPCFCVVF